MASKKTTSRAAAKRSTKGPSASGTAPVKSTSAKKPRSMPKEGKDPKGGLTAKGRAFFEETEGAHLRPGVQGPADTPEKMVRKGSFLRRHFANPRGPMKDEKGEPTRLALSAHAWGEPVPENPKDAAKLADKGHQLLEQYHEIKDGESGSKPAKEAAKKAAGKKTTAKKTAAKKTAARKTSSETSR